MDLRDRDRADSDAQWMQDVLQYKVASWQFREREWLGVFKLLRISTAITVSVFTVIAGLAMFNTLAMIVLEKTKDIAILRSMGYTREDISRIFVWQALIVLVLGSAAGCFLGAPPDLRRLAGALPDPQHFHPGPPAGGHVGLALCRGGRRPPSSPSCWRASCPPGGPPAWSPGDIIRGTAQ